MRTKILTGADWNTKGQYLMGKAAEILFILFTLLALTAGRAHSHELFTFAAAWV